MKTFVNVLKVLSVAALVSSCAYENDPGLKPKADPNANQTVNDAYDKKSNAEVLTAKYKTLGVECAISSAVATADQGSADGDAQAADATTPPAQPADPVTVSPDGKSLTVDFIAQQKKDAKLEQPIEKSLLDVVKDAQGAAESNVTVKLKISPITFDATTKKDEPNKKIWIMKHSPKLQVTATFSISGKENFSLEPVSVDVLEKLESKVVFGHSGGNGRPSLVHSLTCKSLGGELQKDEDKDQWLDLDCAVPVPDTASNVKKAAYKLNCQPATPPATEGAPAPTK